jgi:predicted nucleotidyltransferase
LASKRGKKKTKNPISTIKRKVLPILKRHAVKHASIFGSFARGTAKPSNDVDFLMEYKEKDKSLF